ncbi:MAG: hypothetical protein ACOC9E_05215, partial [Chloroflexota bacterium]
MNTEDSQAEMTKDSKSRSPEPNLESPVSNPQSPPPAIQTQNLRKEFGDKVAVADLTLEVEQGE